MTGHKQQEALCAEIKAIYAGEAVTEGAGVKLRRVFGYYEIPEFDPFLMFDDFRSDTRPTSCAAFPGIRIGASKPLPMF